MHNSNAPESFRGLLLRHRGRSGLIQRDLAARAGVSVRTIQEWQAGDKFPTAERLQAVIRVLLEAGGLRAGLETSEARAIWAAAERDAPRMNTPFDQEWFAGLLATDESPTHNEPLRYGPAPPSASAIGGEAPSTIGFVGRADELALLGKWVL